MVLIIADAGPKFGNAERAHYRTPHPSRSNRLAASSRLRPAVSGYVFHTRNSPNAQMAPYMINVHDGPSTSISGRNVSPTTKLASQLVPVATPLPADRTPSENSSLCIQGTFPSPIAYDPTYSIMLISITTAAPRDDSHDDGSGGGGDDDGDGEMETKEKPNAARSSPRIMNGSE